MSMTRNIRLAPMTALLSAFAAVLLATAPLRAEPIEGIVAIVGDEIILLSDLEEQRAFLESQPGFQNLPPAEQRRELLDRLIDDKVLLLQAKKDTSITVTDKEVVPRVEEHIGRLAQQQGGEDKLSLLLKQTSGMTLSEFKERLIKQYREQAYKQKIQMKYVADAEPSMAQVQQFYKEYQDSLPVQRNNVRISHLQHKIKAGKELERQAFAKADSLIKLLDQGADFAELAKEHSEDFSAKNGGDLDYTRKGTLDPDFERAAFRLALNEYTKIPVKTRFGFHLVKVTGKKDNSVRTSHILIRLRPGTEDTARAQTYLDSLKTVASEKGNFAQLAAKLSDDNKSRAKQGSLGWFTEGQLDPAYAAVIDTLAVGGISDPVLIDDSFHLFRLDEKMEERKLSPKEDWVQISQIAKSYFANQKLSSFVESWRKTVHIENKLASFDLAASSKNTESDVEGERESEAAPGNETSPN